ncbi:TIGR02186 family protein [Tropicimonas marinistellae]|uniref:TIGR02186 family protein n=1 Tax=Tropicimonas marinistellae TaxID=1739787 RepID=UPI00082B1687|nr:TIGR02186 family protein [Tropicimonas marinistellae]
MIRWIATLVIALSTANAAQAQQMVADLSQSRVSITASFAGSHILVFGAVRETAVGPQEPFDVIITVSGPLQPVTVRKKDRVAGIWVNTEEARIDAAPTFYNISTTGPMADILSETADLRHSISTPNAIRAVGLTEDVSEADAFTEALIRIRRADGTYTEDEGGVTLIGQTLFRTDIELPSNIVEGTYLARIFMIRDQRVVATFTDVLGVQKVGLERWIYTLAQEQAALYGLLSLTIAIAAGWGASATFRYIRGS